MTATKPRASRSRLFIGVFPTGISYADRHTEENGDYKKLAFLDFATLTLEIPGVPWYRTEKVERGDSPMLRKIKKHANAIQAKRGEQFETSASGQTITLGYAGRRIPEGMANFRPQLEAIGAANGKTAEQVYALWHKYANDFSDQSKFVSEFLNWYRADLPNLPDGMHRLGD